MGHWLLLPVRVTTIRVAEPLLQCSGVSQLNDQLRSGTHWVQANWQVTVEGKSSVKKLAGVFPSQITTVREGGATSSTDVAEPAADSAEVYKTSKEFVPLNRDSFCVQPNQINVY